MYIINVDSMSVILMFATRKEALTEWDDLIKYGKKGDKMVMSKSTDRGDIVLAKATATGVGHG